MASKSIAPCATVDKPKRRQAGQGTAVLAVALSQNEKLGAVSATTVSIESCGPCPWKNNGCYAQQGPLGWMVKRMDTHVASESMEALAIARAEADAIDGLRTGLPLRLHVAGDCASDEAAQIVSGAAERYSRRNRAPAWTYTHAWRAVKRSSWGQTSVMASCETADQADAAMESGYAAAMVVEEYPNGKRSWKLPTGATAIPCPQTTGAAASCADCRLCWNDNALRARRAVITFAAHGSQNRKVRETLRVLNGTA